ncbi:MAG: InlB B-repeat-containing protein [Paludibacteraceae bacterium]|nr:InlB B-repeat-containing protein [Paludibacteraceae bacterium]
MLRGKGIYLAFANSKNITTLNLPEIMDGQHSVYYDGCLLYHEPDYVVGTYHVKEGTRLIASGVFSGDNKIYELVLPEGLRCICANAIDYMGWLHTITIPESVLFLQDGFLSSYCGYLKDVYCYRKEPLDVSGLPGALAYWSAEQKAVINIHVPYGSRAAYQAADKWKEFVIVEMEPVYTVTFEDYNGNTLKTETVMKGANATAPDDPEREGYNFTGWDTDFDYVTSDLTVRALYKESPATSLDAAEGTDNPAARKLLRNGILYIEPNGTTYTAQGQRID